MWATCEHARRTGIMNRIDQLGADIACVQETNDAVTTKTQLNEYIIYQGKAADANEDAQNTIPGIHPITKKYKTKGKGGTAIAIKENPGQYITKVEQSNGRIMTMRIKTKIQGGTLIVINSHVHDMSNATETRK